MNEQIRRAVDDLDTAVEEIDAEIKEAYENLGSTGKLVVGRLIRARAKIKKARVRLATI